MKATEQLHGWKAIALYFNRSVRCVQRWERKERLPVHRHSHSHGSSVYAFREEMDAWWGKERKSSTKANVLSGSLSKSVSPNSNCEKVPMGGVVEQSNPSIHSSSDQNLVELIVRQAALTILQTFNISLRGCYQEMGIRKGNRPRSQKLPRYTSISVS